MVFTLLGPILLSVLALPHGGRYLPPVDPESPESPPPTANQPGTGPGTAFQPGRWEWWFDFNEEGLVGLRERMTGGAVPQGERAFRPLDDELRLRRVLPALVDALRHSQRDLRATAAMSLGRLRLAAAVPYVEAMLGDPDLFVRVHSLLALGATEQAGAIEPLVAVLDDARRSTEERFFAAAALGLTRRPEAAAVLAERLALKRLMSVEVRLRWGLVYAAGVGSWPELVAPLLALRGSWSWKQDAGLRAIVAAALGRIGSPEVVPALLALLEDKDNQVRRSAAAGLGLAAVHLDRAGIARLIAMEPSENDWPTRFNLLRALAATRHADAGDYLRHLLSRCTSLVRPHVALALGLHGDLASVGPLLEELHDQHEVSVQAAFVVALGLLDALEARPVLVAMQPRADDPGLAGYLALALGLLSADEPEVLEHLDALLEGSHDLEAVRLAGTALALLGARSRIDALGASLDDRSLGTMDRAARVHLLGLTGDREQLDVLLAMAADDTRPTYVVRYALGALGDLADPRTRPPAWRLSRGVDLNQEVDLLFELYRLL